MHPFDDPEVNGHIDLEAAAAPPDELVPPVVPAADPPTEVPATAPSGTPNIPRPRVHFEAEFLRNIQNTTSRSGRNRRATHK